LAFAAGDLQTHTRERWEHCVFRVLLNMILGLEQRLMDGSKEDAVHIASLVCLPGVSLVLTCTDAVLLRSKRVSPMRELTTRRAWKGQFSTGLLLADSRSILLYLVMLNPTEVFITNAQGHCYVRVDWTGLTLSKICLGLSLFASAW
jgi:hypothetical protein